MNDTRTIVAESHGDIVDSETGFIDLLIVLAKHKKLIIGLPLIVAIAAAGLSFAMPDVYKASSKFLPPQQAQSGAAALLSQLGGAATGLAGIKNPNDLYIGMLRSRTIADKLIGQYDLKKIYNTKSMEQARRILESNTTIAVGKDGLITIDVEDQDRKRVALLTNSYVDELFQLTRVLAVTEASQRRMFFEKQLELSKNNLANAEMTLKGALDTHGVINVDSDSRAIVETVARLRAQISAKEIQLNSMQAFVTTNNQDYKRAQQELNSSRAELSKLENGRPSLAGESASDDKKQIGLANIKLLRDVKYYQMLYELLAKQYEVARLDEAKDTSMIQVLDIAIEPEKKFKPKRALMTLMAAALALFAAFACVFVAEICEKMKQDPKTIVRWKKFKTYLQFK
ncbi:GumC family protein [Janthinobacterium sp. PSPC3-1]|uniref:GumC family protein n=1 Tax=Janthinobacterium sp. PSPC3-1 TaxID=2804653 RepID=UPI003CED0BEB